MEAPAKQRLRARKQLPELCYLCGQKLARPINRDHVPMLQLWAPELRKKHEPKQLLTIPVHKGCNSAYELDEHYFVKAILPFVPRSYSGNTLFRKAIADYHDGKNRPLMQKILKEFERSPNGIILPGNKIVKRFDSKRISRVAWKIVRGLHFHHSGQCLPVDWTKTVELCQADESFEPPDHFKAFMTMPNNPAYGAYQGVFSYRFKKIPEADNLHYWALLILDCVLMIVAFHDLDCACAACTKMASA